jgi:hypothetical protein
MPDFSVYGSRRSCVWGFEKVHHKIGPAAFKRNMISDVKEKTA